MLVPNAAVELDIAPRWSVTLPIYYSALNYFSSETKFRVFVLQPEIRYWLTGEDGFYAGLHAGFGYYNLAFGGDTRIQDADGDHPAFGGGLALGYRMPLKGRWKLEFSVGVGVYPVKYDKFDNYRNGQVYSTVSKTYFGPDQASVSLIYSFDLKTRQR